MTGSFVADSHLTEGVFRNAELIDNYLVNTSTGLLQRIRLNFSYGNSNNETRPKSKFFSLLIYAGYPIQ